jgi:hypothetical protein
LTKRNDAIHNGVIEIHSPQPAISLDPLIAEAKHRARRRRLLILAAALVVAAIAAAVTFGSQGGGSGQSGAAGAGTAPSDGTQTAQVGPFALTVPRGLYAKTTCSGVTNCPVSKHTTIEISDIPFGRSIPEGLNRVYLEVNYMGPMPIRGAQLPLNLQKLHVGSGGTVSEGDATLSAGTGAYGAPLDYAVHLSWGKNTSAAQRAAILRALSSIRRSG